MQLRTAKSTGHEIVTGRPAYRHDDYPRVEKSLPTSEEPKFTDNATADMINSMEVRWHKYNLGFKPIMKPLVDRDDIHLRHYVTMNSATNKVSASFIFQKASSSRYGRHVPDFHAI